MPGTILNRVRRDILERILKVKGLRVEVIVWPCHEQIWYLITSGPIQIYQKTNSRLLETWAQPRVFCNLFERHLRISINQLETIWYMGSKVINLLLTARRSCTRTINWRIVWINEQGRWGGENCIFGIGQTYINGCFYCCYPQCLCFPYGQNLFTRKLTH